MLALAMASWPLAAQPVTVEAPLVMEMYSLRYRPAAEAIAEVQGLLSERGTVELQPEANSLVLRDTRPIVRRAMARLRDYDQPLRQIRLEIQIVQAGGGSPAGPPDGPRLSAELVKRLRELLRFESFVLVAQAGLEMREGRAGRLSVRRRLPGGVRAGCPDLQPASYDWATSSSVADRPLRRERLIHTNLNLMLERPMVLGLAQTESSERALMVVLTSHLLPRETLSVQAGRADHAVRLPRTEPPEGEVVEQQVERPGRG